jgi:hypothetical protein
VTDAQDAVRDAGAPVAGRPAAMTYEEHLDEVATQITERYAVGDEAAIAMVMRAQADDFFSGHDDDPSICTLPRAGRDARAVFGKYR